MRTFLERLRHKVTTIKESKKNIDNLGVNELVLSLWTYKMTLPSSNRSKGSILNASSKEKVESKDESESVLGQTKITIFINKSKIYMKVWRKKNANKGGLKKGKRNVTNNKKQKNNSSKSNPYLHNQ